VNQIQKILSLVTEGLFAFVTV